MIRLQDNTVKLLIEANEKIKIKSFNISKPYWSTTIDYIVEDLKDEMNPDLEALMKSVKNSFSRYIKFLNFCFCYF